MGFNFLKRQGWLTSLNEIPQNHAKCEWPIEILGLNFTEYGFPYISCYGCTFFLKMMNYKTKSTRPQSVLYADLFSYTSRGELAGFLKLNIHTLHETKKKLRNDNYWWRIWIQVNHVNQWPMSFFFMNLKFLSNQN